MIKAITLIGIGGAIGSISRYLAAQYIQSRFILSGFPYGTLAVNVLGCLVIGIVYGLSQRFNWLSPEWRIFLTTGFCGGFTTFSTFSIESVNLMEGGEIFYFAINIAASIIIGFAATYSGISIIKSL
ncbi:MAG: fluoride efflux transporter CrcB [Bacteroidia bacterium]